MAVRAAKAYSKRKVTHFTRRSKVKYLNYIKTVPAQKIVKFNMGDISKYNQGKFKNIISIFSNEKVQIRDLALEATRQMLHNKLQKRFGENYYLACKPYPHQIIRNNKTFSGGTKGERVQSGMKHSFGTSEGRTAPVKVGGLIFLIAFENKKDTPFIRDLCKSAIPKLPCSVRIIYEELE